MPLASSLQKAAKKAIARFGGAVTFCLIKVGTYDTATGKVSESITDTALRGVLQDIASREVGDLIQAGDKRLLVAALDLPTAPKVSDRIVINNVSYQIILIETIEQDNKAITHNLVLRA